MNRRDFVRTAIGSALVHAGAATWTTANPQSRDQQLTTTPLRDGLLQISGAGGNVIVHGNREGLALVDSGAADRSGDLMRLIAQRFDDAPVRLLFNTHWHLDHTGGNDAAGAAGAKIIAHENTRLWMSTEFYVDWQDRTYPPRAVDALPSDTFYSSDPQPIEVDFGGEPVMYGHLREAHTDGDIYVFFPERNVIAAGGAVTVGGYPIMDYITGGWIGGLVESTRKLIEMADADTLIVPQSGPAQSRAHLEAQEEMLSTVRGRVEEMALEGKSAEEMLAAGITADFDSRWGSNSRLFISNLYEGLWWGNRLRGIVA